MIELVHRSTKTLTYWDWSHITVDLNIGNCGVLNQNFKVYGLFQWNLNSRFVM